MKTLLIIVSLLTGAAVAETAAQCNSKLAEQAASMSGKETIVIREFKIKLEEGNMDKPMPVGRYAVMLNEGMHYRITLVNSALSEGRGVVQLYDRTLLLGSTYNAESGKDYETFDFICSKTKTYQVLAFFREGKPGCMAAVLSMILPDSATVSGITDEAEREILYIGIDNPLLISSSDTEQQAVNLNIDQGSIEETGGEYRARVIKEGLAMVHVEVLDSMGNITATDSVAFDVRPMPLPVMMIAGRQSGTLSRQEIQNARTVDLWVPVAGAENYFSLLEYSLITDLSVNSGMTVAGNQLPLRQKEAILSLTEGSSFLLTNAVVSTPDGSTHKLPAQTYWLGW